MAALDRAATVLAARVTGSVLLPVSPGYDDARKTFNGTTSHRPALIVRCRTSDDAAHAFACARSLDLPVSVRGGGHSVAGHGVGDGALMIDLSPMRSVSVDVVGRTALVAGGCLWDDVDAATQAVGLAVPGGTYGDTGVGGLTVGGGVGWLLGTAGLTCDNLIRAEVVTASGELVVAGDDGDPELLWALRGGGGNFGVVTSFELSLHDRGPMVGGYMSFALDDAAEILDYLAHLHDAWPDELVLMPWIARRDGVEGMWLNLGVAFAGSSERSTPVLAELRTRWRAHADDVGGKSYLEVQAMNGRLPFGLRHYWKGYFTRALESEAIDAVVRGSAACPDGRSGILLEAVSGVATRIPEDTAAFGHRDARWNITAIAIWDDPLDDGRMTEWARATASEIEPYSLRGGGYVNYGTTDESPERAVAAYGTARFERLQSVKRTYDPENRLRFNLNIPPAVG